MKFGGGEKFSLFVIKIFIRVFPKVSSWAKNNVLVNTVRVGVTNTKIHTKLPSKNLKKRKN